LLIALPFRVLGFAGALQFFSVGAKSRGVCDRFFFLDRRYRLSIRFKDLPPRPVCLHLYGCDFFSFIWNQAVKLFLGCPFACFPP